MPRDPQQNASNRIRILIVDDYPVIRRGLKFFLMGFDDLELIGEAMDGPEALRLCTLMVPDVVLMDLLMPGLDGISTTKAIRRCWPQIQVIALTAFAETQIMAAALTAGATDCLLKDVSIDDLARSIRAAYRDRQTFFPPNDLI